MHGIIVTILGRQWELLFCKRLRRLPGGQQAREVIRKFFSSGWVTVGKKWTIAIDGRASMVPAYKIELPKSEQKKTSRKK